MNIASLYQISLEDWKNIATIIGVCATLIGVIIATSTLIKAVFEYVKQGTQKRYEQFRVMEQLFNSNETFRGIATLLEDDDSGLRKVSYTNKREFLGFFEEIALMVNSKLIRPEVAHYMFGYFILRCWESENFWDGINRESHYWDLFKSIALEMQSIENEFEFDRKKLRF